MFRQVIAQIRRQDWMAVAIELIVVIVGVFIGVQASNWNEQLETDQRAAVFTEHLKSDLRQEAWMYEMLVGYYNQVLVNAKRAADGLTGTANLSDEALLVAAYRATQYYSYTRYSATYDELTSTGQIGPIRDSDLRQLAMSVYTQPWLGQIGHPGLPREYRTAFRMALPYQVQQTLAQTCGDHTVRIGDYEAIEHALEYPCSTGLEPAVIAASADVLRKDPKIIALLQLRIADLATDVANLTTSWAHDMRDPLRRLAAAKP